MLKKIAYAVITSGLSLAPLGRPRWQTIHRSLLATVSSAGLPAHEQARMDTVEPASERRKPAARQPQQKSSSIEPATARFRSITRTIKAIDGQLLVLRAQRRPRACEHHGVCGRVGIHRDLRTMPKKRKPET